MSHMKIKLYYSLTELNSCVRLPIGKIDVHHLIYFKLFNVLKTEKLYYLT